MSYSAGDYLSVLPTNPAESVKRVLKHFGLSEEATIMIKAGSSTTLPTGKQVQLKQILAGYVELSQPASKRNLETLIDIAKDETKAVLQEMAGNYKETIMDRRVSVLDLLCANPSLDMSLSSFLNMVPSMRVRQYSISSSPLWNPGHVTLTISVINTPAASGSGDRFLGVASNFLANLQPGDMVQLMVRPSPSIFSLPADVRIPLVLFCAGSGIAPMRGFIQERAMQFKSGRMDVGKILLFFGCRYPDKDYLYFDSDLKEWAKLGIVDVRPAFSRATDRSEGCRYIQDRVIKDGEDVKSFYRQNAKVRFLVMAIT
jgi:cytochrome P450/NADPH-cytochrome P450 reductase